MYNVILDKQTLQTGRAAIRTLQDPSSDACLPAGTVEILQFFIAQAKEAWEHYEQATGSDIYIKAITSLTLAAELVAEQTIKVASLQWRNNTVIIAEWDFDLEKLPAFNKATDEMLKTMSRAVDFIKEINKEGADEARLMYAVHLTDLGVKATTPPNAIAGKCHPMAYWWSKERATARRNLAATLISLAKIDEWRAKELWREEEKRRRHESV